MRKWICIMGSLLAVTSATAQLEPLSDQYLLNALAINPAYAGNREALSITLLHRNQWTGFDGAPRTETLSLHAPMKDERVGLGILAMNDRAGIANTLTVTGNFSYKLRLGKGIVSLGLGGGISHKKNSWSNLTAVHPDDVLIPAGSEGYFLPDFSVGVYYHTNLFFAGISMPMFLSHSFDPASGSYTLENNFSEYNYFINGGRILQLSSRWKILPSVMVRIQPVTSPQADFNAQLIYLDRFRVGLSYRTNQSVVGLFMFQVNNQLALAYSYDLGLGDTGRFMGGSHEIMIRYDFRYIIDVMNPRYF